MIELHENSLLVGEQTEKSKDYLRPYYGFGDSSKKTWFISMYKRKPYKELVLLFVLGCKRTDESIYHPDTYPIEGTVLKTIEGEKVKVISLEWI